MLLFVYRSIVTVLLALFMVFLSWPPPAVWSRSWATTT